MPDHMWEIRNPDGGASGMEFARARMAACDIVLAHALPQSVDVEVRDEKGVVVSREIGLRDDAETPMSRLTRVQNRIVRANVWPDPSDEGRPVILYGGEVGILVSWWNDEAESEWRWSVEFHNTKK